MRCKGFERVPWRRVVRFVDWERTNGTGEKFFGGQTVGARKIFLCHTPDAPDDPTPPMPCKGFGGSAPATGRQVAGWGKTVGARKNFLCHTPDALDDPTPPMPRMDFGGGAQATGRQVRRLESGNFPQQWPDHTKQEDIGETTRRS